MEPSNKAFALLAAACAVVLGSIALASLVAAVIALPASPIIERMRSGERPTAAEVRRAFDLSNRAARIFEPGRYGSDAALAAGNLSSIDRPSDVSRRRHAELIDAALAARPASPHNWVRRAAIQLSRGDEPGARASLETSMTVGRFIPGLTVPRLRILLTLLQRQPDPALERYFEQQARIAARIEPQALAAFADGGAAEGKTQRALFSEFALYAAYLDALEARRFETAKTR